MHKHVSVRVARRPGFTLIEVLVVTVVVAVIASITTISYSRTQADTRDNTRAAHAALVATALEKYYDEHGEYPSPRALASTYGVSGDTVATTLSLPDKTVLLMPKASSGTTNSIAAALGTDDVLAYTATSTVGNDNCQTNAQAGCEAFTLQYKKESDGSTVTINSTNRTRPDDNTSPLEAPSKPTLAATQSGTTLVATSSITTCATDPVMTPEYSFRTQVAAGAWSAWSAWQAGATYTTSGPTNGTTYGYQVHTRCVTASQYSDVSLDSDVASVIYYTPPTAPSTPTITAALSGTYAQGASGTVTCDYGSAQYRIDWRTNDGTWSTGTWGTGLIANITAAQGSKYGFRTTARCVNGMQTTQGATSAEATYIHPINAPGAPTVSGATQAGKTWTWSTAACPSGTSAGWRYQFTNSIDAGVWVETTSASAVNTAATSQGITYGINVQQNCYTSYTSSDWSATAGGGTFVVPVAHRRIVRSAFRLTTHTDGKYYTSYIAKSFTAACAAGTDQDVLARTSRNTVGSTNNWVNDGEWFLNVGVDSAKRISTNIVDSNDTVEIYYYGRCRNTTTGHVTDANGDTSVGGGNNIGNLYSRSGKYNIKCAPNGYTAYCSGAYDVDGAKNSTSATYTECRERTDGISDADIAWTARINNGSNTPCWNL